MFPFFFFFQVWNREKRSVFRAKKIAEHKKHFFQDKIFLTYETEWKKSWSFVDFQRKKIRAKIKTEIFFMEKNDFFFFLAFMALLIEQLKIWQETGREREREGEWHAAKNPGPLQSLGTWDAHSTHWAKGHPEKCFFLRKKPPNI